MHRLLPQPQTVGRQEAWQPVDSQTEGLQGPKEVPLAPKVPQLLRVWFFLVVGTAVRIGAPFPQGKVAVAEEDGQGEAIAQLVSQLIYQIRQQWILCGVLTAVVCLLVMFFLVDV